MPDEDQKRRAVADQLRAGARGYASGAAEDLLAEAPEIGAEHGAGAYFMWQGFLSQRIAELATAVELDEPGLFTTELNWLYSTLSARDVEPGHVRRSVSCLGRTLQMELPDSSWRFVRPVVEYAEAAEPMGTEVDSRLVSGGEAADLAEALLKSTLRGDASGSIALVLDAYRAGMEAGVLYERVILPVQAEVGTLWQRGEIGIADEHVATELLRTTMMLLWHEATGGEVSGPVVVVGSVTGDQHDTGVRAAAHILDINGVRGICLGCDVPGEEFALAAARFEASAVIVSATMTVHLPRVRQVVAAVKAALPEVRVVVGGPAFGMEDPVAAGLAHKLGADAYARTPTAAAGLIGSLH